MVRQQFIFTLVTVVVLLVGSLTEVAAEIPSRLRRIDIKAHQDYTRLIFQLDKDTSYSLGELSGNRFRLTLPQTDSPLFRRLRSYSDQHLKGISVANRGGTLQVTIGKNSSAEGVRVVDSSARTLVLDIGPRFNLERSAPPLLAGREPIWIGAGKFVKEYDPPVKSELPFVPTDQQALRAFLNEEETSRFLAGEAAIYKGQASEAVSVFSSFMERDTGVGALATYRCAQAYYSLLEYDKALQLLRKGESLWPQFLEMSPDVKFAYADCLVRGGDLPAGRKLLAGLIASKAEKKAAPILLVRLADILARQQRSVEAGIIYGNVVKFFPDNKASSYAAIKLADRRFFAVNSYTYPALRDEYQRLARSATDFIVREEAFFKAALLDSLFGAGSEALATVSEYEKRYPRGFLASLARAMHIDLMPVVYRETMALDDAEQFVKIMELNAEYLSKCMAEPLFITDLDKAYRELGQIQQQNKLFGRLLRRDWAIQQAPFMYEKIIDNSILLADWKLAEATGQEFIQKFPSMSQSQRVRELMGDIDYRNGNYEGVKKELAFLVEPKVRALIPESYYYLGKVLETGGQIKSSGKAMELFITALNDRKSTSPLISDAYFIVGTSLLAERNSVKAMASFNAGLEKASQDGRDRFIYRIGDLQKKEGRREDAKKSWEMIVKEGRDPVWQKLAAQELANI
jgi:TolA-binding protein